MDLSSGYNQETFIFQEEETVSSLCLFEMMGEDTVPSQCRSNDTGCMAARAALLGAGSLLRLWHSSCFSGQLMHLAFPCPCFHRQPRGAEIQHHRTGLPGLFPWSQVLLWIWKMPLLLQQKVVCKPGVQTHCSWLGLCKGPLLHLNYFLQFHQNQHILLLTAQGCWGEPAADFSVRVQFSCPV